MEKTRRLEAIWGMIILSLMFSIPPINALPNDAAQSIDFTYSATQSINYSLVNVNNSQFLQGLTPQQVADLFTSEWLYNQTADLSGYAKYQFTNNNFNGSGNFTTTENINGKVGTFENKIITTVNDVTNLAMSQVDNAGGAHEALGLTYTFNVYAYKNIDGVDVYSANPGIVSDTDNGNTNLFWWHITWDAVSGAEGYKIIIMQDDYYGIYGDYSYSSATNSLNYADDGLAGLVDNVVVTPSSPANSYGTALNVTGNAVIIGTTELKGELTTHSNNNLSSGTTYLDYTEAGDKVYISKDGGWASDEIAFEVYRSGTGGGTQFIPSSGNWPPGSSGGSKTKIGVSNTQGAMFDLNDFVAVGNDGKGNLLFTTNNGGAFKIRLNITGTTGSTALPQATADFKDTHIKTSGIINATNNVYIEGNLSVKRPYWHGYDNSTQNFLNTANVQVINISNNADYDSYGISVVGQQNITFDMTGDYICILSPEFFQNGGGAVVTFWYQVCTSGNCVDVPWSNSRYSMTNNEYHAPAIPYQFDITSPSTQVVRFMWWSDSTNTQIYSSGALTSPTRPSIPGTILNCQKVSEVTT